MNLRKRIERLSPPTGGKWTVIAETPDWMPDSQIRAALIQDGQAEPFDLLPLRRPAEECASVTLLGKFSGGLDGLLAHIAENGRRIGESHPKTTANSST